MSAEELFARAVEAHRAGDLEAAEGGYREAVAADPRHAAALTNLGAVLARRGNLTDAAAMHEAAAAADPDFADAHFNLGNVRRRLGQASEAVAAYRTVLRLDPVHPWAHQNLGLVLGDAGDHAAAAEHFRRVIALLPTDDDGFHLLWDALTRLGKPDEAEAVIRPVAARSPNDPRARLHLGLSLTSLGRTSEAVDELEEAVRLRPDYPEAHNALGVALDAAGRPDDAAGHYREAVRLRPGFAEAWSNLGVGLGDQGRVREAAEALGHALELRPDPVLESNRLVLLVASSAVTPHRLRAEHEQWAARHADALLPQPDAARRPDHGPRLRVGYVFAEPRTRAVGAFVEALFTHHDRNAVHVTAYPNAVGSALDRLRKLADAWKPLAGLTDAAAADLVGSDEIDVLVDLCGHTAGNRLLVFARRPAPVQVTLFGYPCTTGLRAIDFRISDAVADPPGTPDTFGTEKVLRLPNVGRLYVPPASAPGPNVTAGGRRVFTFGCLNNPSKLSDACLDVWAQVLRAVPQSRLVLQAGRSVEAARRLTDRFTRLGVSSDRVELTYRLPEHEYYEAYQPIDAALDPFPFNGRATTCDALWMGVPVLSVAGADGRGRQGLSILSAVGLPDFVADGYDKFVDLAATWAEQREALADLRGSLREMLASSPVTDAVRYVRDLEAAYATAAKRG